MIIQCSRGDDIMGAVKWEQDRIGSFLSDAPRFVSRITVRARQLDESFAWNTERGSELASAPGDWVLEDETSQWTVAADVFRETYERLVGDRYRKKVAVQARQVDEDVTFSTLEGDAVARRGDWILRNPGGDVWPVTAGEFARRYAPEGD